MVGRRAGGGKEGWWWEGGLVAARGHGSTWVEYLIQFRVVEKSDI